MDKDPKVAELLQQLEELKRRKAQKLLKLQKLGKRSGKLSSSGSRQQSNFETSSNKPTASPLCSRENKAIEPAIKEKCPKCDSNLKKYCICNAPKPTADKTNHSKFTFPLHPSNLENNTISQQKLTEKAKQKLLESPQDSKLFIECNGSTICKNNANSLSGSQISALPPSAVTVSVDKEIPTRQVQKNEKVVGKHSFNKNVLFPNTQEQLKLSEIALSKSNESSKLQTDSSTGQVYEVKKGDIKKENSLENKASDISFGNACYENNYPYGIGETSSNPRKRSTSVSDQEDIHEWGAKKMRVSDEFKLLSEEENRGSKSRNEVYKQNMDFSPDKECFETKQDLSSNISLMSGSFTVDEIDENLKSEIASDTFKCAIKSKRNAETPAVPFKENSESSENNCSISSMKLGSPFSDELTFPVAVSNIHDENASVTDHFLVQESLQKLEPDKDASCNESKVISTEREYDFKSKMNERKQNGIINCVVPENTDDSEILEPTLGIVAAKKVDLLHDQDKIDDNLTPSLNISKDLNINMDSGKNNFRCSYKIGNNEVILNTIDKQSLNELDCDSQTGDLELDSTSLVAVDTVEDTIQLAIVSESSIFKVPSVPKVLGEANNNQFCVPDSELFTIPETEMIAPEVETMFMNLNKDGTSMEIDEKCVSPLKPQHLKADHQAVSKSTEDFDETCETLNPLKGNSNPFEDNDFLDDSFSESLAKMEQYDNFEESLMVEDTLELGNYKNIPFLTDENQIEKSLELNETDEDSLSHLKFASCVHSDIQEPVHDIKIAFFNKSYYTFTKFIKWIQVCRLEGKHWNKIFSHEVEEAFQLNEICFTKNDTYLVLVMLLKSDQGNCLQFVLFEKDTKVIKLMEQTHWLQNNDPEESVLLCGLDFLKFSTAQGRESFEVFVHAFSCLDSSPRLLSASLGPSVEGLHSLCQIEKLPNAMIGTSGSMLYVWHLLETRLVTSVCLHPEDILPIEKCFWAIIENGLIYFLTLCADPNSYACQLFVANLATGFCQLAMPYNIIPGTESKNFSKRNLSAVYSQPFLVASSSDGSFLWSINDEYCSASLSSDANVSAITITNYKEDSYLIALGTNEGIVNFYTLKCS